ncbi:unnamed protein product, partial [Meganyctiphanes norvegica]
MQQEGQVRFLKDKRNSPTCCSFHPKDRYLFVCGGSEGEVVLRSALLGDVLRTVTLATLSLTRAINALTFTHDGAKVLATAASRRASIVDVERGETVLAYDNCTNPNLGRQPLVMHPDLPYLAACATVNGRGITLLDLRMPLPLDFIYDLHEGSISELCFLDGSWPWGAGKAVLMSASESGQAKVSSMDGRPVAAFTTQPPITALTASPEPYNKGWKSVVMASTGEGLVCWGAGEQPWKWIGSEVIHEGGRRPSVTRMKYTYSGGLLYTATQGVISRYRRYPEHHQFVGQVFAHSAPVLDLDISPYDEC